MVNKLLRTTLAIEGNLLKKFDRWMSDHSYSNRSEAMRDLIRGALVEAEWDDPATEVVGVLSIVYDHARHTLSQALTDLQHQAHHSILCSQHVHLDRHKCAEVLLMKGKAKLLRQLAEIVIATRGVKTGKLTLLSESV